MAHSVIQRTVVRSSGTLPYCCTSSPIMCSSGRQPAILCIGRDRHLLEIRCRLLERLGNPVILCFPYELQVFSILHPVVVLLCHTLTAEQYQACITFSAEHWAQAQIRRIIIGYFDPGQYPEVAFRNDHQELSKGVQGLLQDANGTYGSA